MPFDCYLLTYFVSLSILDFFIGLLKSVFYCKPKVKEFQLELACIVDSHCICHSITTNTFGALDFLNGLRVLIIFIISEAFIVILCNTHVSRYTGENWRCFWYLVFFLSHMFLALLEHLCWCFML